MKYFASYLSFLLIKSYQGFKLALKMKKIQETEFKRYEQVVYDLTQEIRTVCRVSILIFKSQSL